MKPNYRIFGFLKHISPENLKSLQQELPYEIEHLPDGSVDFEYEGNYLDMDDLKEIIQNHLDDNVSGRIDVIDNLDWQFYRWTIAGLVVEEKKIDLDHALEKYHTET